MDWWLDHGGQPSVALLAFVGHSLCAEQVPPLEAAEITVIVQNIPSKAVPGEGNTNLGACGS